MTTLPFILRPEDQTLQQRQAMGDGNTVQVFPNIALDLDRILVVNQDREKVGHWGAPGERNLHLNEAQRERFRGMPTWFAAADMFPTTAFSVRYGDLPQRTRSEIPGGMTDDMVVTFHPGIQYHTNQYVLAVMPDTVESAWVMDSALRDGATEEFDGLHCWWVRTTVMPNRDEVPLVNEDEQAVSVERSAEEFAYFEVERNAMTDRQRRNANGADRVRIYPNIVRHDSGERQVMMVNASDTASAHWGMLAQRRRSFTQAQRDHFHGQHTEWTPHRHWPVPEGVTLTLGDEVIEEEPQDSYLIRLRDVEQRDRMWLPSPMEEDEVIRVYPDIRERRRYDGRVLTTYEPTTRSNAWIGDDTRITQGLPERMRGVRGWWVAAQHLPPAPTKPETGPNTPGTVEVEGVTEAHRLAVEHIGRILMEEANARSWCGEYDAIIARINERADLMPVSLPRREDQHTVTVRVFRDVAVEVNATSEAGARDEAIRQALRDYVDHGAEVTRVERRRRR